MIFKITLSTFLFANLTLVVIDEVLDRSDKEYHTEQQPDCKKNNNENRKTDDIDNLWSLFEIALVLADNDTADNRRKFSEVYDKVHDQLYKT